MKPFLSITHVPHEGLGTLGDFFNAQRIPLVACCPYLGDPVPADAARFSGLIIMGGPMSVNDTAEYPFLADEVRLIQKAVDARIPVLGICLGSQLIAKALGGRVYPGPRKEIGWYPLTLSEKGREDALLSHLVAGDNATVFHWHGETFDLPRGAELLASSERYAHQAFCVGEHIYGLQFHIEMTEEMIGKWVNVGIDELKSAADSPSAHTIIAQSKHQLPLLQEKARRVYERFFSHVASINS